MSRESIPTSDAITAWEVALPELAAALNHTLDRISPTRTGIVTDQMRAILRTKTAEKLLCIAASSDSPHLDRAVIAIAVLTDRCDTSTILHMDWVQPKTMRMATNDSRERLGLAIWQKLKTVFSQSGISFVQWATDPITDSLPPEPTSVVAWPMTLHFERIGTLDYLALDCDEHGDWGPVPESDCADGSIVQLRPMEHDDAQATIDFEQLVQRTYVGSLDCPPLEKFRSASEIISGYRQVAAYAPELWFTVEVIADQAFAPIPIGSLILAKHPGPALHDAETTNPAAVMELVYMGITPEHRGRGYGQRLMWMISDICQQQRAERLILAVDQNNHPAIAAYHQFGMQHLFRETVWGRSVITR
jgi:ribosomal protein S18 acetylase RimI-like enzyme